MSDKCLAKEIADLIERQDMVSGLSGSSAEKYFKTIDKVKELEEKFKELREENKELRKEVGDKARSLESWEDREHELLERENKCAMIELEGRIQKVNEENALQRMEDHKKMVELVFRNSRVRETIFERRTTPVAVRSGDSTFVEGHTTTEEISKQSSQE